MKPTELTLDVVVGIPDETIKRCCRIIEMWMDDNPDARICCDRKATETGFTHRVYIERRTCERKDMAEPSKEY